jgi:hypothetical protein
LLGNGDQLDLISKGAKHFQWAIGIEQLEVMIEDGSKSHG